MGATGSNSPKFTPLLSNAVTPQTSRPKCLCLLHPIMSSLRHYLSFSPHLSSLGDLIFCHVFLIFTSMFLPLSLPFCPLQFTCFSFGWASDEFSPSCSIECIYQERGNAVRTGTHAEFFCFGGGGEGGWSS